MDGNGRWAQRQGLPRTVGHGAGEESLLDTTYGALVDRREGPDGLRLLDRELAPTGRRGPLPHELQPRPAGSAARTSCTNEGVRITFSGDATGACREGCSPAWTTPRN